MLAALQTALFARPAALLRPWAGLALVAAFGCAQPLPGDVTPTERPVFPTGLAVHPGANLLAVVSSNFDLGFGRGALLIADLDRVDEALADSPSAGDAQASVEGAYVQAAFIPSFGNEPIFAGEGERLLVTTRDENLMIELDLDVSDGVTLSCGDAPPAEDGTPICGTAPRALSVPGNDPFSLALYEEGPARHRGLASSLQSDQLLFFRLDVEGDETTLQREDVLVLGSWLDEEENVVGVRGLGVRPAEGDAPTTAFAVVERTATTPERQAVDLVWFPVDGGGRAPVSVLPLTRETGATSARGLALTPEGDALLLLLRDPDGIARVELAPRGGGALAPFVSTMVATCRAPVSIELGRVPLLPGGFADRAFVTCLDDDAVLAYQPSSLEVTAASRFFGAGPYDVALDLDHAPPRAYVSYFLDDSVGVFDLVEEGRVGLFARGRIGQARPQPERGQR